MKLKTPYKTVMFYGNVLRINVNANWLAVDKDGTITAFTDEPCVIGSVWDVTGGEIWNIDARAKLEDENWKDTLTHCPHDQKWMIEEAAKLEQVWELHATGLLSDKAKERALNKLVDVLLYRAEGNSLQDTWDSWIKHTVQNYNYLHDEDITHELHDKLLPKRKKPEYLVIEDYYGRDVVVPPQTRWIAMNINGDTYAYEFKPVIRPGCWRENINGEDENTPVAWYPPEIADRHWQDSLREVRL